MAELKIKADSGGGTVSLKGPATTTSNAAVQLTLPVDDGTSGQYLKTDGSGALSWATVAGGVDGISSSADATAITIDSSERVMIGTTTEGYPDYGDTLTVADSDHCGITIRTGTTHQGSIYFSDDTSGGGEYRGSLKYEHASEKMSLVQNTQNRLELTGASDGAGDVKIVSGNLVIGTSGKGIDFSAQTATSATDSTTTSELLDHYEEGTWTPIPKISHVTTGITAAVSGAYTKIGRLVHISFKVNFSDKGSNGGQFTVHGLPFAENGAYISGSSTGGGGAVFYQQGRAGLTTDGEMTFRVESSMLYMQCLNSDNATVIPGGGELADDTHFFGHGTYYA